ncbi:protein LOW PSII ACCUMULATION 3 [Citrus sinensis]|uniref:Protein LOW PSII ACCUMULATION 3 n=1 Tax=Citrus sinensis TaxID=2711 RepID=A0ACB8JG00_CITSI|nr:protein LOW PSII ACCUMULATION 3 [Citrus sinensis]
MAMSQMASTLASPLSFLLLRHSLSPYIPRQHSVSSPLSKHQHSHQILCAKKSSSSNNSKQQKPKAQTASSSLGPKAGVAIYKPKSYEVLAADAANSLAFALQDGKTRLEIDFPPLPSNISSYKGSSDEFIDANIQLALAVVRKLQERMETRACIVFPDKPEKGRASRLFKRALDSIDGITIGSLDDVPTGAVRSFFSSIRNTLDFDFDDQEEGRWQSDEPPTLYVFINCSTRELSVIEKRNLLCQPQHYSSILNWTHYALTWAFWDFHPKICITGFFLSLPQCFISASESTQRLYQWHLLP